MNDQPSNPFSTPERRVSYVDIPPPITPLNARVTRIGDINIDPVIKNPPPSQNQTVEDVLPVNLFQNGEFGGRKKRTKKHRRGKKTKRTNKKTRRFFRFGGMDPFVTPPNSPPRLRMPPPVIRAPRVNQPPAGVFQGQNLMAQFNAIGNRDEEGYTDSEDMTGGADKRRRSYTTYSEDRRVAKKPKYSSTENSSTETINSSSSSSLDSLTTQFGEANITSSMSPDKDMSATTKGGYRRKTKRRTSRKRRATRK
jgi:hypothetical protein